jgi:hypothetical protein
VSPTARTLKMLRDDGWLAAVVERWNSYVKIRQDLFGFIDVIAVKGDLVLAVQATDGTNVSKRVAKIRETPAAALWLGSHTRQIVVHGWSKRGARGKAKRWSCRIVRLWPHGEAEVDRTGNPVPAHELEAANG